MLDKAKKFMDGESGAAPHDNSTCPFSEGCKRHYSPGDIVRYAIAIALSVFLLLLVISLFFPRLIPAPDMAILRDLANILHHIATLQPVPTD